MTEFISTCSMPLAIVFLIAGFFLLVKGADVFVEGSSSIAKRFQLLQQSSIRIRWQSVMWSGLIFLI